MMFLLDTNVVSELRKVKTGKADKNVVAWAETVATNDLFLSAITILELELGIGLLERRDELQGKMLRIWLENQVLPAFENRILPVDTAVARRCAKVHIPNPCAERDALIAATALVHKMTVVTRNIADFFGTGVEIFNPFDTQM